MFDDNSIRSMGMDPDRCRAKAKLFRVMAERERERSLFLADRPRDRWTDDPISSQQLVGVMHEAQIGLLFQTSAECSILMSELDASETISLSGEAYLSTGTPYGLLLSTLFPYAGGMVESDRSSWERKFNEFMRPPEDVEQKLKSADEESGMRSAAMKRPEQMTWLFLSAANSKNGTGLLAEAWQYYSGVMDSHGHLPVGPLGIPVSAHLHLFDAILRGQKQNTALDEVLAIAFARRSEALTLASRNKYLWTRGRSPVALFDFHLFALASSAAKHGLMSQNSAGDIMRVLDEENPLMKLVLAPMNLALDGRSNPGFQSI